MLPEVMTARTMENRFAPHGRWMVPVIALILSGAMLTAQNAEAPPTERAAVEQRLTTWTRELEGLRATTPPGEKSFQARIEVLEGSIEAAQRHLQALQMDEGAQSRLKAVEKASKEWNGPTTPPPYSVTEADRLRSLLMAAIDGLQVAEGFRQVVQKSSTQIQESLAEAEASIRRAHDLVDKANGEEAQAAAREALSLEEARLRLLAEEKEMLVVQSRNVETNARTEALKRDFALRQLKALGPDLVLPKAEYDRILAAIEKSKKSLEEERQRSVRSSRAAINLRVAETGVSSRADVINWRIAMADLRMDLWKSRHAFLNESNPTERLRRERLLLELLARSTMWRTLFESRQRTTQATIFEWEGRIKAANATPNAADSELLAEFRAIESLLFQAIEDAKELENLPAIWGMRPEDKIGTREFGDWLTAASLWTTDTARSLWQFELYTVEDTVTVDGRTMTGKRAITLGKVLILAAIIFFGYLLLRSLAARVARRFQEKFHLDPGKAQTLRRWIFSAGMVGLGLYALHYVRIPLTAFAFLGGALAIGVGFGTQNLIRNFISGLLIHAEKPLRVGDVLEVGQVQGTVASIGMRSSVIRHWDGIETLIPNSAFLENNVTNWTYSDRQLRHSVRVGVAYGSDTRKVVHLLIQAANSHGKVLRHPEPYVLFDDFAESSLVFSLFFWIDMTQSGRAQVASDLRFMIENAFSENDISMAFPQRDMHLATDAPLDIRVLPS